MADVLDIAQIEKELRSINQQRSQARERLDALKGGGRGRGRGDGRPGIFSRLGDGSANGGPRDPPGAAQGGGGRPSVFDRLYSQGSGRGAAADRHDRRGDAAAPAAREAADGGRQQLGKRLSSRISSAVVVPADTDSRDTQHADADAGERPDAGQGRKRLLSAVVVNGHARQLSGPPERASSGAGAEAAAHTEDERPAKRPALAADDKTKRRAARMFGTLLVGTLQKFQNDEQAFKKTDTAQRRAEIERRAQERAEAEAQRLREEAATAWREERSSKLNALHDLNLQAEVKALELRFAKRIQVKQQLAGFCVTSTQPPLCWLPKQVSRETEPLVQQAQEAFEAWKQQQLQDLEAERAEVVQAAAAKRESALTRLAARKPPGPGGDAGNNDEDEEDGGGGGGGGSDGGGDGQQHDGAAEQGGADSQQEQQYSGDEEQQQQQQDEDMQQAAAGGEEEADEQQQQQRVRRSRPRGSDDDEERLLSSDDEDV